MIDRNRALLVRLVALLAAMICGQMSRAGYHMALARLRPLESALRRLIVIAAQGVVAARRASPAPNWSELTAPQKSARNPAFPLFDPRRKIGPHVHMVSGRGPQIRFLDEPFEPPDPAAPKSLNTGALLRRLARLERALGRINAEAKRLARWNLRHAGRAKRPMRPGRPPGFSARRSRDPVQQILEDLQLLALRALETRSA